MSDQPRRHFSPEEKIAILRRHLLEKVPVSDLCDKHGIQANQFYQWQKIFFENGAAAFAGNGKRGKHADNLKDQKIALLETKLQRKDEVIATIMHDHVLLKKSLGET